MINVVSTPTTDFAKPTISSLPRRKLNKFLDTPISTPILTQSRTKFASIELLTNTNAAASQFLELVSKVRDGIKYYSPELCSEGVNGTYFLKDKNGEYIAVFKPQDEEGLSLNNPKRNAKKSNSSLSLRLSNMSSSTTSTTNLPNKGIMEGEACLREVAAYFLDHEKFYGVPKTHMVKITHKFNSKDNETMTTKIGSLQEFVENEGCSEDFGPKFFSVDDVHKIGILDIQMCNLDRHAGNMLIKKNPKKSNSKYESPFILVPIDQGFSLPELDKVPENLWWEWMNWPQAKIPFSDEVKSYVQRIDIERDIQMLQKELDIRPECLQTMTITTTILKIGINLNFNLFQIGSMLCKFQELINKIKTEVQLLKSKKQFKYEFSNEMGYSASSSSFFNDNDDRNDNDKVAVEDKCARSESNYNSTIDDDFFMLFPSIVEKEMKNIKMMNNNKNNNNSINSIRK